KQFALKHLIVESGKVQIATLIEWLSAATGSDKHRSKSLGVADHVGQNIEAHHVNRAEGGRLGQTDGRACKSIHIFDGEVELLHQARDIKHVEASDAVADEVWRVLGVNDSLAEVDRAELRDRLNGRWITLWRGDNLQQVHVARRVEEVGAKPVVPEVFAEAFGDGMDGKAASVGGDDGSRLANHFHLAQQRTLNVEILHHDLDDPVTVGKQAEMIFEVYGSNQACERSLHESCGLGFARSLQAGVGDTVAHGRRSISGYIPRNDVEEVGTHPGICQVRGDA